MAYSTRKAEITVINIKTGKIIYSSKGGKK